ncbi:MAG: TIR domain-containing protein, partial [Chloroflexi bacterium]|nr:TIR domain-containing protein [Chloroflexota bacterium]
MESLDTNTPKEPKLRDIVCLYSQADESFYLQLKKSLNLWERGGHVRWLEVRPGEELSVTLRDHVKRADLILFLLSSDFFADERCYQTMHLALQEQASRQVPVVPILVRAVNWQLSACKDLAIVPHNEQPVASWPLPDEAYTSIGADLVLLVPGWPPIPSPAPPKLFQVRDLPNGYVPRPAVFDEIKHRLLTHGGSQTTAITTALRGAGGFGKTTLALALCHDPEIREAFPDGILWRDLGEHSPEPLMVLNEMLHVLEPSVREALTLEEARKRWKNVLKERSYLLVIDDVWQTEALEELLQGGPHCGRLVTTRNDQMLPEDAKRVWVDAMEPEEAMTLLCQGLIEDWHHTLGRPVLERVVVQQLGCWPLLVSLARGMLTNQVKRLKKTPEQALALVEQAYNDRGMAAFHLGDRIERQRTADACLEVNLRQLEKWAPPHYQARQRYQELAVFPEDMDIPLTTLQAYWQGTGGLHTWEAEDLCLRLVDLSLLLPWNPKQGAVRLHDVLRNYLIQRAGVDLPALHARLLDAYQRVLGLARWADLPRSEAYLWQHLILHLCQAGHDEALQTTLADLGYLARKALYVGVSALEADLFQASTWPPAQAAFPPVTNLSRTIVRIRHLLYQAHTYAEMGSILLSYLTEELATVDQRRALELELPRPFLTNWHPLLNRASSALRCTLRGHTDWVQGCTVSSDGRFIVSASDDHTLKVWDTASGAERLTLSGHTDKVNGCAVSGDGRVIVSASFDGTLKVWDTISGAERLTLTGHTGRVFDCAMSGDGRMIVSASADKTLKVWDAVTGAERLTLTGHSSEVNGCAVSRDGRVIVSASADKTLKVWDAVTGTKRLTLTGHTAHVDACAISPNGRFIVSASWDNTLKVWDRATGAEVRTLRGHINSVSGCAVSLDGSIIVSASYDGTLKVWDAASGAERLTLSGHTSLVSGCAV